MDDQILCVVAVLMAGFIGFAVGRFSTTLKPYKCAGAQNKKKENI